MPTKGREIIKVIHKNGDFVLYHLREKIFFEKPYIFRVPVIYPLREKVFFIKSAVFATSHRLPIERTKLFRKTPTKTVSPCGNKQREKISAAPKKMPSLTPHLMRTCTLTTE